MHNTPMNVAIITARGGSKRIPRKNIKPFLGRPIIKYSIDAALKSKCFDEVMVSTDDEEIAKIAKKLGAKVPFIRSAKNSDDKATTAAALLEVLEEYNKLGLNFEYACCIYPAAPFVTSLKLKDSFEILKKANADSIFPVVQYSYPIQRALEINTKGFVGLIHPEFINTRSNDLKPSYHDCGQFYWFKIESFLKNKQIMVKKTIPYIVSDLEAQDIDVIEDWKLAELKFKLKG